MVGIKKDLYYKLKELSRIKKDIKMVKNLGDEDAFKEELYRARRNGEFFSFSIAYMANMILENEIDKYISDAKIELFNTKKGNVSRCSNAPDVMKLKKMMNDFDL